MKATASNSIVAYHRLRSSLTRYQKPPVNLDEQQTTLIQKQADRELTIESVILTSPEARGVVVPEASVNAAVDELQQRYESKEQFVEDLHQNGISLQGLGEALERQLRVEAVMEAVSARTAAVSELDAQIHYYTYTDQYQLPETRTARHILITINQDFPENSRVRAAERAAEISKRLKKKPTRFVEQAAKHSECPTAMQGGLLGRVKPGQLFEAVDKALFALKAGEVSAPVESELGFHVLCCDTIHPAGTLSVEEALPSIQKHLQARRQRICQQAWLSDLLKKHSLANDTHS